MLMKKNLLLCLMLVLVSMSNSYAKNEMTKEERAQAASEIVAVLESKQWIFLPKSVTFAKGVSIDKLETEQNQFLMQNDTLSVQVFLQKGTVHNPTKRNVNITRPNIVDKLFVQKNEISVSKNNKTVTSKLEGTLEGVGQKGINRVTIEISVNVSNGTAYLNFRDHETKNAIFYGVFTSYENVDL